MTSSTGSGGSEDRNPGQAETAARQVSDFHKRCVALMIDVGVAYFTGIVVAFICGIVFSSFAMVQKMLSLSTIMVIYLLIRDYLFAGRGIGKNLMGLQVVSARFKQPANLLQSIVRNITWLLPFVILSLTQSAALFIHKEWLNEIVSEIVHGLGAVYCLIVFPLEAYRAYYLINGTRLGDQLAGTRVVEAEMDFSRMVPRQE